tara:strand:+ start:2212 stop:2700 length:489 start_codon:yes stop_codon:yes gene_type:complete
MEQSFDRPIPGMGMTHEVGARPWQNPPTYATVEEAVNYYVERMSTDQFRDQLIDVMEMGIPLTTMANTIQLASVMEGVHTVDVGMMLLPILVELLKSMGDASNVQYVTGMEKTEGASSPTAPSSIINNMMRQPTEEQEMQPQELSVEEETDDQPMGLMARRT